MRDIKQVLRGEFPGEDRNIVEYKCLECGYVRRYGDKCPMCESREKKRI